MWETDDRDRLNLVRGVYKSMFGEGDDYRVPYHRRSAKALQDAVKELRKLEDSDPVPLARWVCFVHFGA
jgi:hypothetical protein